MDPDKRRRLLWWLYLVGPTATLILFGLAVWIGSATGATDALNRAIPSGFGWNGLRLKSWAFAPMGWLLLTLGCSVGTCFELSRRRGMRGGQRVFYVVMVSSVVLFAHFAIVGSIAFVGCAAIVGSRNW